MEEFISTVGFDATKAREEAEKLDNYLDSRRIIIFYKGNVGKAREQLSKLLGVKVHNKDYTFVKRGSIEDIRGQQYNGVIYLSHADNDTKDFINCHIREWKG